MHKRWGYINLRLGLNTLQVEHRAWQTPEHPSLVTGRQWC